MKSRLLLAAGALTLMVATAGCDIPSPEARTNAGVRQATVHVKTDAGGVTVEQGNIAHRLEEDNRPGAVKHLYVFAQGTGVCFYSSVKGKVTSSGKRLVPSTVDTSGVVGLVTHVGGEEKYTGEVMNEDGSYGRSTDYLFWWDVDGRYFQLIPGAATVLISDNPIPLTTPVIKLRPVR